MPKVACGVSFIYNLNKYDATVNKFVAGVVYLTYDFNNLEWTIISLLHINYV